MLNEQRLFELLPAFFDSPLTILKEIAQNAQRSGATRLTITIGNGVMDVLDNGHGADNPVALFSLADSTWSETVMENQTPAGWGLFFLLSVSVQITYRSCFGSITVDCRKFLTDVDYRDSFLNHVNVTEKLENGFHIKVLLKEGIDKKLLPVLFANQHPACLSLLEQFSYLPLTVLINGVEVRRSILEEQCVNHAIKTTYLGNDVYINPYAHKFVAGENWIAQASVIWYGIPIRLPNYAPVVINVMKNNPLTPVLPYRHSIKEDDKAKAFTDFVRREVRAWCLNEIEKCTPMLEHLTEENKQSLTILLRIAEDVCAQSDLDNLPYYYVTEADPYYSDEAECNRTERTRVLSRLETPLVSEMLQLVIDKQIWDNEENYRSLRPVLPPWTITEIRLPKNKPAWLERKEKTVIVRITTLETHTGTHRWYRCLIKSEKDVQVIAAYDYSDYETNIYYRDEPEDFWQIGHAFFSANIYNDEGDTYDTQSDTFEKGVDRDIAAITGKYRLDILLKGFSGVAEVYPDNVLNIHVDQKQQTMQIITNSGKTVELKLAV